MRLSKHEFFNKDPYSPLHCFGAPFLSLGALLSTGATFSSFYLFVEFGLLLYLLSSIYMVRTRPALHKKKPACMFEMNKIMFRPNTLLPQPRPDFRGRGEGGYPREFSISSGFFCWASGAFLSTIKNLSKIY